MEGCIMAMNQKQREHFVDRVKSLTRDKINAIRAMHAGQIQEIASKNYEDFVRVLGLEEDMNALKTAHQVTMETAPRVKGQLEGLSNLLPDHSNNYTHSNPSLYWSKGDAHSTFEEYLRACCKATAEKEFYNTEAGQELKALEETQQQAIDTIMMDGSKVQDLTLKLNGILGKSDLQLTIGEGVHA